MSNPTVFKYEIGVGTRSAHIRIHRGAKLLYANAIEDRFWVWALVDEMAEIVNRPVCVFLTGDKVPEDWQHVSSFLVQGVLPHPDFPFGRGPFLGHVFDGGER